MKSRKKIIFGALIVLAIAILAVSLGFPPALKGISSGTFGKADKYRKSQMTEKDIQLRSELTADTAKLRSMIQGLVYFTVFTEDLSNKMDSCVSEFQLKGMTSQDAGYAKVMLLKDYVDYMRNSNVTLGSTINLLAGFYGNNQADQSVDVDKTLRDFGNYVKTLLEKDSILEPALVSMDHFMLTSSLVKDRKEELISLKSIRDQLLIQGIELCGLIGAPSLCANLTSYGIDSQANFNSVLLFSREKDLSAVLGGGALLFSQEKIEAIASVGMLFANPGSLGGIKSIHINAKEDLQIHLTGVMVYDKANLSFHFARPSDLQRVIASSNSLDVRSVLGLSSSGLQIELSNFNPALMAWSSEHSIGNVLKYNQLYGVSAVALNVADLQNLIRSVSLVNASAELKTGYGE